jgi:hypothetical protein
MIGETEDLRPLMTLPRCRLTLVSDDLIDSIEKLLVRTSLDLTKER